MVTTAGQRLEEDKVALVEASAASSSDRMSSLLRNPSNKRLIDLQREPSKNKVSFQDHIESSSISSGVETRPKAPKRKTSKLKKVPSRKKLPVEVEMDQDARKSKSSKIKKSSGRYQLLQDDGIPKSPKRKTSKLKKSSSEKKLLLDVDADCGKLVEVDLPLVSPRRKSSKVKTHPSKHKPTTLKVEKKEAVNEVDSLDVHRKAPKRKDAKVNKSRGPKLVEKNGSKIEASSPNDNPFPLVVEVDEEVSKSLSLLKHKETISVPCPPLYYQATEATSLSDASETYAHFPPPLVSISSGSVCHSIETFETEFFDTTDLAPLLSPNNVLFQQEIIIEDSSQNAWEQHHQPLTSTSMHSAPGMLENGD